MTIASARPSQSTDADKLVWSSCDNVLLLPSVKMSLGFSGVGSSGKAFLLHSTPGPMLSCMYCCPEFARSSMRLARTSVHPCNTFPGGAKQNAARLLLNIHLNKPKLLSFP